ncbi:hypothetical protein HZY93_03730 [Streptococcus danieliae]|uniref:Uncharacterized protein n=1 Tax=Streptococcus danieliae TaxID=747656 RepID=A0A7Z0LD14_9STRE|nr:hypothetical protein [Streptococcus danieliae]MBF0717151.1 hypothetical protein [Streptococcus danieliae]NYS49081.1 hypothetical protein [Streptococcus danieliae]
MMKKIGPVYFMLIRLLIYSTLFLSHWGLIPDFQAILYLLASLCLLFDIWKVIKPDGTGANTAPKKLVDFFKKAGQL